MNQIKIYNLSCPNKQQISPTSNYHASFYLQPTQSYSLHLKLTINNDVMSTVKSNRKLVTYIYQTNDSLSFLEVCGVGLSKSDL